MVGGLERIDASRLHPLFLRGIERVLSSLRTRGHRFVATSGYRPFEEQQRLFDQGRGAPGPIVTRARPGYSAHNWGLAVDLAYDPCPASAPLSREAQLEVVAEAAAREGLNLDLVRSPAADGIHVQLDLGRLQITWNDLLTVSSDGDLDPVWSYLTSRTGE
jgi:peptidoglycan L-alanyl-D-glutamate endopeptidase CwlK